MINHGWWKDKSVLITGANGFIGNRLKQILGALDAEVFTYEGKRDGAEELGDSQKSIDIVFHLAANTLVKEKNMFEMIRGNTDITLYMLEWALTNKAKAMVVVSSDRVYGDGKKLDRPYDETCPLLARDPYGVSKILSEISTRAYAEKGLPIGIARLSNVYGPGDKHLNRIIPSTINSLLLNESPVLQNASPKRDYVYVHDVVEGILNLGEYIYNNPDREEQVFNLSGESSIKNSDIVNKIVSIWGWGKSSLSPKIINNDETKISHQWADSNKARKILNWNRHFDLYMGLEETIDWWKGNYGRS